MPSSLSRQLTSQSGSPFESLQRPGDCHQLGEIGPQVDKESSLSWDADRHHSGYGLPNGLPGYQISRCGR